MTLRSLFNPLRKRTPRRRAQSSRIRLRLTPLESRVTPSAPIPVGPEFQVNTTTAGVQGAPSLAMDAVGNFVIAWHSIDPVTQLRNTFAQRFNADGVPQGNQFQVNSFTNVSSSSEEMAQVAMDADGNFVIAWGIGYWAGCYARRYDSAGVAQGAEFQVSTYGFCDVGMDAAGNFTIMWQQRLEPPYANIYCSRYDPQGALLGTPFLVNSNTAVDVAPHIGVASDGRLVATWAARVEGVGRIYARWFDGAGAPIGPEFTYSGDGSIFQEVAIGAQGNCLFTWRNGYLGPTFAQQFAVSGSPIGPAFQVESG